MATTKNKSTTKKPAAKPVKNTKSTAKQARPKTSTASAKTKSTKSAKAVKPTKDNKATTAVKVKKAKKQLSLNSLRKLQLAKAFILTALAVTAGFVMTSASYALTIGYMAKDELISVTDGKTAFVSGSQSILDIQVKWLLVAILGISALMALLTATKMRKKYEAQINGHVSSMRWVAAAITTALIVESVALLSGVSDMFVLKLVGGLIVVTSILAWTVEKRLKQAGRPVWTEYVASLITGTMPWILIGSYAVATWVYGLVRYPWFVYALMLTTVVSCSLIAVNQYKHLMGWKNYLVIERNYQYILFASQVAFAVILILGFQR